MRGKRFGEGLAGVWIRIIPAHAGQTNSRAARPVRTADHPRTCGANFVIGQLRSFEFGSSPHMRGKRISTLPTCSPARIIPAHAGQTCEDRSENRVPADHPRTCGANMEQRNAAMNTIGSSPHMRGKRSSTYPQKERGRIIPAHAGQTRSITSWAGTCTDHPRTCGANTHTFAPANSAAGSSPHMRGKHDRPHPNHARQRIIPAHAGQTPSGQSKLPSKTDHPRTCGANAPTAVCTSPAIGSSPHMRGKPGRSPVGPAPARIIPAHAGQTVIFLSLGSWSSDHPRTCGANGSPADTGPTTVGSSPHMRGKLIAPMFSGNTMRIIPAHAGQTKQCVWCP